MIPGRRATDWPRPDQIAPRPDRAAPRLRVQRRALALRSPRARPHRARLPVPDDRLGRGARQHVAHLPDHPLAVLPQVCVLLISFSIG